MISFTDRKLYVKGTCQAQVADTSTGDILYQSNKFQTASINTSVNTEPIRAGLGNGIAAIIPSDSDMTVDFNAADFSMWAKAAQVGAALTYNAPVPVCQIITATTTALTLDLAEGAPVAQLGQNKVVCYVLEVGANAPIGTYGAAYDIDATGKISGFTAVVGTTYKVWYFVNRPNARVARLSTAFDPKVVHFTAQLAVYANDGNTANEGTHVGWLYIIVPRLKLGGNGGVTGDQTTADTTSLSGRAIAYDDDVVSATCDNCNAGTAAYYVYVPDDESEAIAGLALVGGVIAVKAGASAQAAFRLVMENGELVVPRYEDLVYKLEGAPEGTTIDTKGVINAGSAAGDCTVTATFGKYSCEATLSVLAAE